jgi:hypothetical protein
MITSEFLIFNDLISKIMSKGFLRDHNLHVLSLLADNKYVQSWERSIDFIKSEWPLKTVPGLSRWFEFKYWITLSFETSAKFCPSS